MNFNYYNGELYYVDHKKYGGEIYESDFCTDHPRNKGKPSYATRIAKDMRFDNRCRKNYKYGCY